MSPRLDELPRQLVTNQVRRLTNAFPGGKLPDLVAYTGEVQLATRGWTTDEFLGAIMSCVREERYFPRISAIVKHRPERQRRDSSAAESSHSCRSCGRHFFYAGFEIAPGVVVGRIRCACRVPSYETQWHTPRARAWRLTDERLVRDGWGTPDTPARED